MTSREPPEPRHDDRARVVLFSGGRGSAVLSRSLLANSRVELTLAINGYDDGLSTGAVRQFLGDSLGPSDFRKNATRLAKGLGCASGALVELLDLRFPDGFADDAALAVLRSIDESTTIAGGGAFSTRLAETFAGLAADERRAISDRLRSFHRELDETGASFPFSDCSLGNLVFAGSFLVVDRDFNRAVDDYNRLLGLPPEVIENVTDGANVWLVAIDRDDRLLASEAEIVEADRDIDEIFLLAAPLSGADRRALAGASRDELTRCLGGMEAELVPNPRLLDRIREADLIVYAPGTQHSSLFPSYLTPGIGDAIAANLTAVKLLITNIQADADIPEMSGVEIRAKALYYLTRRGRSPLAGPSLITHCLLNDPTRNDTETPYVPLGRLQSIEDPRLVRIADYEDAASGRHNAAKVLAPFVESFLARATRQRVAVVLTDTDSRDKISQTLLEALRGGLAEIAADLDIFYRAREPLEESLAEALPFPTHNVSGAGGALAPLTCAAGAGADYVVLFESSGMYRGEDIVNIVSLLTAGRLDLIWGSRRLSVRDIRESYRLRYDHRPVFGAISAAGSHALSLAYLFLYGRYVSDTLSGARAVRSSYLSPEVIGADDGEINQRLLAAVLRDRGELFETPVQFFSISPDQVKRTSVGDGFRALRDIVRGRWRHGRRRAAGDGAAGPASSGQP